MHVPASPREHGRNVLNGEEGRGTALNTLCRYTVGFICTPQEIMRKVGLTSDISKHVSVSAHVVKSSNDHCLTPGK